MFHAEIQRSLAAQARRDRAKYARSIVSALGVRSHHINCINVLCASIIFVCLVERYPHCDRVRMHGVHGPAQPTAIDTLELQARRAQEAHREFCQRNLDFQVSCFE